MLNYDIKKCSIKEFIELGGICDEHIPHSSNYYVAVMDDNIVGEIAFCKNHLLGWSEHYFIGAIDSQIERQGIGTNLFRKVEEEAINEGISLIALRPRNLEASRFWHNRGFEVDLEYGLAWKKLDISS